VTDPGTRSDPKIQENAVRAQDIAVHPASPRPRTAAPPLAPELMHAPIEGSLDVAEVMRVSTAYKLVSREARPIRSTVFVDGVPIGPGRFTLIAGPCAIETPEQTLDAALTAQRSGATLLRGGAFKPRTSPYAFQGLGRRGLEILSEVSRAVGLPTVTEVLAIEDLDLVAGHTDMLQIGARNMQNFALLRAVGSLGKPVLLKRGLSATIDEWLLAAEHVAHAGTLDIVLCERGIRTFETATRNTLDISAVPVAQRLSHLPVIVDPSHSGGRRDLVVPLARAAIAAGADGLIVDVHPDPTAALCDGAQALDGTDVHDLAVAVRTLPPLFGRAPAYQESLDGGPREQPRGGSIPQLRTEIDRLDEQICALARRRTEVSRRIGAIRLAGGGPRIDCARESKVTSRYASLGPYGAGLAKSLLDLGRDPDLADTTPDDEVVGEYQVSIKEMEGSL
jgi:3-deoxy-7-phosphoheptulonate synthase